MIDIMKCTTIEQLGKEPEDFELWCIWKYKEMQIKSNVKNKEFEVSRDELRQRCADYASDVSWAISQHFLIEKRISDINKQKKHWYNKKHLFALKELKKQGNSTPALKSIEAYVEHHFTSQWGYWEKKISDFELKKKSLDEHKQLWMKLDRTYTSLVYDMNSEWYKTIKDIGSRSKQEKEFDEFVRMNQK